MAKAKAKAPAKKATGIEARLANIDVQLKTKVRAVAGSLLPSAIESWKKHAVRPPVENSGYYKRTWDVWFAIKYAGQVSLGT